GPVATAAAVHFALATPNWLIQEAITSDVPWRDEVVEGGTQVVGGYAGLPAGPGLGVEINEREAARHPVPPQAEQRFFHPDGSVAAWQIVDVGPLAQPYVGHRRAAGFQRAAHGVDLDPSSQTWLRKA